LPVDLGHSRRDDDGVASGRDSAGCPVVRVEAQTYRVRNSGLSAHHYRQPRPQELGWTEGRNIQIDIRWAGADANKARTFAKELVAITPDVIVPSTNLVTAILQQETLTIPIVFVLVGDPVGSGFVASMARPGGNLTGFSVFEPAIGGKWLEIFNEIAPVVGVASSYF
jgi:hypothetical protein